MSEFGDKLAGQLKEAEEKWDKADSQRQDLVKQRAELDRQISLIAEEMLRLQGEYRVLTSLSKKDSSTTEPEAPATATP